jgi:hypothetical protein
MGSDSACERTADGRGTIPERGSLFFTLARDGFGKPPTLNVIFSSPFDGLVELGEMVMIGTGGRLSLVSLKISLRGRRVDFLAFNIPDLELRKVKMDRVSKSEPSVSVVVASVSIWLLNLG